MIHLTKSLNAWGTPAFDEIFKGEIVQLGLGVLPLQQGLSRGSYTDGTGLSAMVIGVADDSRFIHAKAGIFYTAIIAGCSCADDPTPVDDLTEYCELEFVIDKTTAEATVNLLR